LVTWTILTVINWCFDSKIDVVKSANPIAGWLVDIANQSSVPDVIRSFHERASSGIYEREAAAVMRTKWTSRRGI
jgi:hypothetical protein